MNIKWSCKHKRVFSSLHPACCEVTQPTFPGTQTQDFYFCPNFGSWLFSNGQFCKTKKCTQKYSNKCEDISVSKQKQLFFHSFLWWLDVFWVSSVLFSWVNSFLGAEITSQLCTIVSNRQTRWQDWQINDNLLSCCSGFNSWGREKVQYRGDNIQELQRRLKQWMKCWMLWKTLRNLLEENLTWFFLDQQPIQPQKYKIALLHFLRIYFHVFQRTLLFLKVFFLLFLVSLWKNKTSHQHGLYSNVYRKLNPLKLGQVYLELVLAMSQKVVLFWRACCHKQFVSQRLTHVC